MPKRLRLTEKDRRLLEELRPAVGNLGPSGLTMLAKRLRIDLRTLYSIETKLHDYGFILRAKKRLIPLKLRQKGRWYTELSLDPQVEKLMQSSYDWKLARGTILDRAIGLFEAYRRYRPKKELRTSALAMAILEYHLFLSAKEGPGQLPMEGLGDSLHDGLVALVDQGYLPGEIGLSLKRSLLP